MTGCTSSPDQEVADGQEAAAAAIDQLADRYVSSYFEAFPHYALLSGAPDARPAELADHSLPALAEWAAKEDRMLQELQDIDLASLEGTPQAVTYKILQNQLESAIGWRICRMELWNVSPTWTGWQSELALLASSLPNGTTDERINMLARLSQIPAYIDDEIENLREGMKLGYSAPAVNVRNVIEQMDGMLAATVEDSPFVQAAGKNAFEDFIMELEMLETGAIRPATARYRDFLRDEYLPHAREPIGVSTNPDGMDCYTAALKFHTTVDLSAQEVHDIGLEQIQNIRTEMEEIGKRSFGTSDVGALLQQAMSLPEYRFSSREDLVQTAEHAVTRAKDAMSDWFGRLPIGEVEVRPYPAFQEKTAPGGFYSSASEPGGTGTYWVNAYKADTQSKAGLESTAFHETYPGHHFQGSIALERDDLHPIARYFSVSGYAEGWALYSERLCDEIGLFSGDIDRLGLLSKEALRAARLVVDSGMHALGWSRQQAIDYLTANTASTVDQATAEIDRYIAVPGQATSYMIGSLEIRNLRTKARAQFGERFDIKAFHDRVLEDGSLPLWVLREKIEHWIETESASDR
jgi:uncharacterized protein (DUF885 family)